MKNLLAILLVAIVFVACNQEPKKEKELTVQEFLINYNKEYQKLYYAASEAQWKLNTYIVEDDTTTAQLSKDAEEALANFLGSKENIEKSKQYLNEPELTEIQRRQLETILYNAGNNPETAGELVKERIAAETKQTEMLFGFQTTINGEKVSGNDINKILKESTDLEERLQAWNASKEVGKTLKDGLHELKRLRNGTVQALGYQNYFDYQVSAYGMDRGELMQTCMDMIVEMWPLYRELHTWARYTLAKV